MRARAPSLVARIVLGSRLDGARGSMYCVQERRQECILKFQVIVIPNVGNIHYSGEKLMVPVSPELSQA